MSRLAVYWLFKLCIHFVFPAIGGVILADGHLYGWAIALGPLLTFYIAEELLPAKKVDAITHYYHRCHKSRMGYKCHGSDNYMECK